MKEMDWRGKNHRITLVLTITQVNDGMKELTRIMSPLGTKRMNRRQI
jgi:hypothetical protein